MLQIMGLQRVGHNLATGQQQYGFSPLGPQLILKKNEFQNDIHIHTHIHVLLLIFYFTI